MEDEITNGVIERGNPQGRRLTAMECAGFIGGFLGGLCGFVPIEKVRDAARALQKEFEAAEIGEETKPVIDHLGEMGYPIADELLHDLFWKLCDMAASPGTMAEALDLLLDVTNPIAQRVWTMARVGRQVKLGKICSLCGQEGHKSENCPNVKPPSSIVRLVRLD